MFAPRSKHPLQGPQATLRRLRDWAARRSVQESLLTASIRRTRPPGDDTFSEEGRSRAARSGGGVNGDLAPILGEFAWHSLTVDPRIAQVSEEHYAIVAKLVDRARARATTAPRVLEVAAYAHTTGYMLHERLGARTDLLDISPSTLRLGRRLAREQGFSVEGTTCVAGDFHDMPYDDDQFDVVYICSALHHTWRWEKVLAEVIRVLAPGGTLLLENEPCRRRFCHYRFRTNRPDSFGELEHALDRLGILRTIAEPYLGTRPETLFGMVENQTIPIGALCKGVAAQCVPQTVTVAPEHCMGSLERDLVARARDGAAACTPWLTQEMRSRVNEARQAMTAADRGMGFSLPSVEEIDELCRTTVNALTSLPVDTASFDYRLGLADIFGASVQITARKAGKRVAPTAARLRQPYPAVDEVICAFPPAIARLLDPRTALIPDIQTAPAAETLAEIFPGGDWNLAVQPNGVRDMSPATARPRLIVPVPRAGPLLIVVRLYVAYEDAPYRIALFDGDEELEGFDVFRADSLLLSPVIQCKPEMNALTVSIRTRLLDGTSEVEPAGKFTISYAGAFPL